MGAEVNTYRETQEALKRCAQALWDSEPAYAAICAQLIAQASGALAKIDSLPPGTVTLDVVRTRLGPSLPNPTQMFKYAATKRRAAAEVRQFLATLPAKQEALDLVAALKASLESYRALGPVRGMLKALFEKQTGILVAKCDEGVERLTRHPVGLAAPAVTRTDPDPPRGGAAPAGAAATTVATAAPTELQADAGSAAADPVAPGEVRRQPPVAPLLLRRIQGHRAAPEHDAGTGAGDGGVAAKAGPSGMVKKHVEGNLKTTYVGKDTWRDPMTAVGVGGAGLALGNLTLPFCTTRCKSAGGCVVAKN